MEVDGRSKSRNYQLESEKTFDQINYWYVIINGSFENKDFSDKRLLDLVKKDNTLPKSLLSSYGNINLSFLEQKYFKLLQTTVQTNMLQVLSFSLLKIDWKENKVP